MDTGRSKFIELTNKTTGEIVYVNVANIGAIAEGKVWIHGKSYRVVETIEEIRQKIADLKQRLIVSFKDELDHSQRKRLKDTLLDLGYEAIIFTGGTTITIDE
jgi:hypothetical protein